MVGKLFGRGCGNYIIILKFQSNRFEPFFPFQKNLFLNDVMIGPGHIWLFSQNDVIIYQKVASMQSLTEDRFFSQKYMQVDQNLLKIKFR